MAWTGGTFAANLKPTLRAVSITLALLFTLIATTPTAAQTGSPSGDRDALAAFYNATDGPNWAKNENWLSDSPLESWYGVETDDGGRVTEVRLGENRLNGRIPVELGRLSNLTVLHLDGNQLSGEDTPGARQTVQPDGATPLGKPVDRGGPGRARPPPPANCAGP